MTQAINSYLEVAANSLDAAELLLSEGYADFAVSRAYYAMFYIAEALLFERGKTYSKHSGVISAFGHELAKSNIVPRHFHRYLIEGQEARLLADYRGRPLSDEDALLQIDRGREMLTFAREHFSRGAATP